MKRRFVPLSVLLAGGLAIVATHACTPADPSDPGDGDGGVDADGGPDDGGPDAGELDAGANDDAGVHDDAGVDGGAGDDLYQPNNGPTHAGGTVVGVDTEAEILAAIADAAPGDVITVAPGTYTFNEKINVTADGADSARIFLRAEVFGTVTFNLWHIENFSIRGKYWIFENLIFNGACTTADSCEHAFHIVADADDFILRSNEIVNFASHVKLNGEVVGPGPGKAFADRVMFIGNFWHNTKYIYNDAPHNILNIDGGQDHVVRGNIFADYATPDTLPKSASAVYPKASTKGMLVEQNLIVCELVRTVGETTRGIQLGDGAPNTICDGDPDQDGIGDCDENGQSQEALVRNNIIMNCDNGGSAAGIVVNSDRHSRLLHNTVFSTGPRTSVFYQGHPSWDTFFHFNVLEDGFELSYANRAVVESNNHMPDYATLTAVFGGPATGDFSLADGTNLVEKNATDADVAYDFCGYPRGSTADLGAIEYSTTHDGAPCADRVQTMFDRIPSG